jgi:DNA-binding Lrp family transcriptional regulator
MRGEALSRAIARSVLASGLSGFARFLTPTRISSRVYMRSPSTTPRPLDDLDRNIIRRFQDDPRVSNKTLAQEFGVAETTIASRIRSLHESGVMRIVAFRDFHAQGYDLLAHIDVFVEGRSAAEVAAELAELAEVAMVALCTGSPQIVIQINAKSRHDLARIISHSLAGIRGIREIETSITIDVIKMTARHTR